MTVRVKICGITRVEDAELAWDAGADAIGLNFWAGSKRAVPLELAARIAGTCPLFGSVVGVFVDEAPETIRARVRDSGLGLVQLHGDEPPEACGGFGVPVVKALKIRGPADVEDARRYVGAGDIIALLLDGATPGHGLAFDWALVAPLATARVPLLVAGGLTPGNVRDAVRALHPYGVDVASGVESAPGIKDGAKLHAFIRAAKSPLNGAAP